MSYRPTARVVAVAGAALLALTACGTEESPTTAPTPTGSSLDCSLANLPLRTPGTLTIGTDSPAYPPYFVDDDPTNGEGFESAVAYALADNLGFTKEQVKWVVVPFNSSYAPGAKTFDFDINQISITPERAEVVDFSDGYYAVQQAVIAVEGTPGAAATTIADLQGLKLGAQVGTTSLKYVHGHRASHRLRPRSTTTPAPPPRPCRTATSTPSWSTCRPPSTSPRSSSTAARSSAPSRRVRAARSSGCCSRRAAPSCPASTTASALLRSQGTLQAITEQWLGGEAGVPALK